GLEIPMRALYEAPTIAQLARLIERHDDDPDASRLCYTPSLVLADEARLDDELAVTGSPAETPAHVLVTGATGFVGAFLVAHPPAASPPAPARAPPPPPAPACARSSAATASIMRRPRSTPASTWCPAISTPTGSVSTRRPTIASPARSTPSTTAAPASITCAA